MGRLMALDYGKKRTGIAVTDELHLIASGLTTVATIDLMEFLQDYLAKENVEVFVIGEPRRMNNEPSEAEEYIVPFLDCLAKVFPEISIVRQDERFTSKLAVQSMIDGGMKRKKRKDKALIDEISATLILQAYLNKKI
ncbi:Holliday junction resolvase RuvX [Pareuzebyella sediminis]|uniref:Holliday junction resolvase RuvX n=1 Tax=Pareuzebyella sediminis TaxID=2607998 RepID=UPI0011EFE955|nr:Holliday junction resolvase RuvX [Pareuzebyella sediminis]